MNIRTDLAATPIQAPAVRPAGPAGAELLNREHVIPQSWVDADAVRLSGVRGHGGGCPCCMQKNGTAAATRALEGFPGMGPVSGYLQMTPELRAKIDALPVKPQDITHVLYHDKCFDGFGARFAAESALGDRATYIPVGYGSAPPELPADAKVAIVDFSYPREQLLELQGKVAGLVVLDHHEKAREQLEGLPFVAFDMDRAGAGLSWAYFHPTTEEPDLLKYVEDRDLWEWRLPQSHQVSAAIGSYSMDFETWKGFDLETLKSEGVAIERYMMQLVEATADRFFWGEVDGHRVPMVQSDANLRSEVGNELLKRHPEAPFAAVYYVKNGRKEWSLRGREGGFDVNQLAKKFGGGGHKAAAGLRDPGPPEPTVLNPPAR